MTNAAVARTDPQHIKSRLDLIEAARGIAAALVVLYHVARHLEKAEISNFWIGILQFGHSGVDLFFVISGFIIFHVHQKDIGKQHTLLEYTKRRITRIYPVYWIALAATIGLSIAGANPTPSPHALIASILLLPSDQEPLLGVAWTLQFEVFFYILFATLILSKRIGLFVFLIWMLLVIAQAINPFPIPYVPKFILSLYNLQFLFGILTAIAIRHSIIKTKLNLVTIGCFALITAGLLENLGIVDGYGNSMILIYGAGAALLIAGCATGEKSQTNIPKWLKLLGSASYSIYLFQFVFIGIAWKAIETLGLSQQSYSTPIFLTLSLSGIIGGAVISKTIEYPIMNMIRRQLVTQKPNYDQ
jgi:peptidoglycan/LPS O-acetylase OafA/YrhL